MAGGEKALAKIVSNYKPQQRKPEGKNAQAKADEHKSAMRAEIEARRNGTFKKK